jgi:hypothetical protein
VSFYGSKKRQSAERGGLPRWFISLSHVHTPIFIALAAAARLWIHFDIKGYYRARYWLAVVQRLGRSFFMLVSQESLHASDTVTTAGGVVEQKAPFMRRA